MKLKYNNRKFESHVDLEQESKRKNPKFFFFFKERERKLTRIRRENPYKCCINRISFIEIFFLLFETKKVNIKWYIIPM